MNTHAWKLIEGCTKYLKKMSKIYEKHLSISPLNSINRALSSPGQSRFGKYQKARREE